MSILKKLDLIVISIILILGIAVSYLLSDKKGTTVEIYSDSKLYLTCSLYENKSFVVENRYGLNKVIIENGQVWVTEASCKDKLDVKQGKIGKAGQSIVCLPNRVAITIKGGAEFDALSF